MPDIEQRAVAEATEQRRLVALRDVDAALDNLIDVIDNADELPVRQSRASGAIAVLMGAAQSVRAISRVEISRREREAA